MSLTKIGSIGINTGIQLAGVTTVTTLKVGSGVTVSSDGDVFFTGIATGNGSGLTALNASNISSGTVPTARLGSGTASSSTFLRGDSTFQTVNTDLVSDTSPQLGGNLDVNAKNIIFGDSASSSDDRLQFGASQDLEIYHNGSASYIKDSGTGYLLVLASGFAVQNAAGSETIMSMVEDGAVDLYYNDSKKLETLSDGIKVTGTLRFDTSDIAITIADDKKINFGASDDLKIFHDGSTNIIDAATSNPISFRYGGSEQFFIGNGEFKGGDNKKIKLGTSDDLEIFHDGSNSIIRDNGTGQLYFQHGTSNKFNTQSGGVQFYGVLYGDDSNTIQLGNDQDFQFNHNGTDSIINSTTGGLYIANAANNQHIYLKKATNGDIRILDSSSNNTHIFETGGALRFIGSQTREGNSNSICSAGNNSLDLNCSEYMYFRVAETERARFQNSNNGYFQIGRAGNTPANCHLGIAVQNTISAIQTISDDTTGNEHIRFNNPNGEVGRIMTTGSSTVYYTSSDYRLKENDVAISDGVARVKQLRPIKFNWKANPSETVDGFFAHEVQSVVPNAVSGMKDAVYSEDNESEGIKAGDIIPQGLDNSKLVPLLVAALQEAIGRIEALETK